jgi:hypothetical protein
MIVVTFPMEGESWGQFIERLQQCKKELLVIISGGKEVSLLEQEKQCQRCLQFLAQRNKKTYLATTNSTLQHLAKARSIPVIGTSKKLKSILKQHPQYNEALREFVPHVWRQHLRSRLQSMGLLSLPKIRIWVLLSVCVFAFLFTVFELLPSATIYIQPKQQSLVQTTNIFLVQSGAVTVPHGQVRAIDLLPIKAKITKTITFTDISRESLGQRSTTTMKVYNNAEESFSLRKDSRLLNADGIIFRIQESILVPAKGTIEVAAEAADEDLYKVMIGVRGNVPALQRFDFMGLSATEKTLVYAENITPGVGGSTNHRLVYKPEDIVLAEKILQQALLSDANQQIDEEIEALNALQGDAYTRLYYDELRAIHFSDFDLSKQFLQQSLASVPITGTIEYTAYAYNKTLVLDTLIEEVKTHIESGKELIASSLHEDLLTTHVMEYADDLSWIKLTVDLSASQQAVLDPLTKSGIEFSNRVRDLIVGKSIEDARKIINNLPEVEKVTIDMWPPWTQTLPDIAYNITFDIYAE